MRVLSFAPRVSTVVLFTFVGTACSSAAATSGSPTSAAFGQAGPEGPVTEVALVDGTIHRSDTAAPARPPAPSEPTARAAREALDVRHAEVAQCYERVLHQIVEAAGTIAVDIAFDTHGAVEHVSAHTEGQGGI